MTDCLFCKIANKEMAAEIVYEDEDVIAFRDIHPKYAVHCLVIPREHLASAAAAEQKHDALLGKVLRVGAQVAREQGLTERGFRLSTNTGADAGQVVHHLHVHVLGGEPLRPL